MLTVRCVYKDKAKHPDGDIVQRNLYILPLMEGLVSDLYEQSGNKKATLRYILRVTRDQLECMFSAGKPYIDLKLSNLMYDQEGSVFIVDFGSMVGDDLPTSYPLPSATDYIIPRTDALKGTQKWIHWQLGIVAFQVAVDPEALERWYYWRARKAQGMRHPGPPVAETDIPTMLKEALPDDLEMQEFILAALNGKPAAL